MAGSFIVPLIFTLLALLFAWLAWRERGEAGSADSPSYKARKRIALIFTLVAILLLSLQVAD